MNNPIAIAAIQRLQREERPPPPPPLPPTPTLAQRLELAEKKIERLQAEHQREREAMGFSGMVLPPSVKARIRCKFSMKYIAKWVCALHGVSLTELRSDRRPRNVVRARQAFCYWAACLTPCSLPTIGRFICKDHSTVSYAVGTENVPSAYLENRRKWRKRREPKPKEWWRT
ncbi:MAG: hypothetical protein GY807_23985 [Gammaproteobacteria bacterium]|nr:hypothetical protein [Gammaproteobacteria bacterium]